MPQTLFHNMFNSRNNKTTAKKHVNFTNPMRLKTWQCFSLDGQLSCNYGMKSTVKSLNSHLYPVSSKKCLPQQVCGVATLAITYLGETGQGKLGSCIPISFCSNGTGCQLAYRLLPNGVSSLGCKVYLEDFIFVLLSEKDFGLVRYFKWLAVAPIW